jgi:hypothetical protein
MIGDCPAAILEYSPLKHQGLGWRIRLAGGTDTLACPG